MSRIFKLSKSALSVVLPPGRPYPLNLLNQHPSWKPSTQMPGLMGVILNQTTPRRMNRQTQEQLKWGAGDKRGVLCKQWQS